MVDKCKEELKLFYKFNDGNIIHEERVAHVKEYEDVYEDPN